jgi:outer membrane protein OmpA-like peptidoglycan-associated protein
LNAEINDLRSRQPEKVTEVQVVEKIVTKNVCDADQYVVFFANASTELTEDAKATLNTIPEGTTVKVEATASPEGTKKFNQKVSEDRAKAVAEFLKAKGVKVTEAIGKGVTGDTSNRIAIATAQ